MCTHAGTASGIVAYGFGDPPLCGVLGCHPFIHHLHFKFSRFKVSDLPPN